MIAFVFPGQGSQKRGMGKNLFDEVLDYAKVEKDVDAILGYSMRQLCLTDPCNQLSETQFTQPSLYVVNALNYYKANAEGKRADYLAGHSLGEYNALLAAGVYDFLTGLKLVKKRGELMSQARNGGMGAVIGLDADRIAKVLRDSNLLGIDIANFNAPSQTVVSGPNDELKRAGPLFESADARLYMPLPVSAAFHSRYMTDAAKQFAEFLAPFSLSVPKIPIISNVTAEPYPWDRGSEAIKLLLTEQITQPVQWVRSVRYLISQGVTEFKETGPGNVLTGLIQRIKQETKPI